MDSTAEDAGPRDIGSVSKAVALQEFERFVEAMDLDVDPDGMDPEDKKGFENAKRRVLRAMMSGALVINESGEPVFTPSDRSPDQEPITFHEPRGADHMAMDGKRPSQEQGKNFALLAGMTRQPEHRFAKMAERDIKVASALGALFLGG